jgi:serine/threonine protein kinase
MTIATLDPATTTPVALSPSLRPAASVDADVERAWIADRLGAHYQVVRPLGRGGMGAVYLARDRALHRVVAIKVLRREMCADPLERERFRREARMMARLNHPNIVPVHSFGECEDLLYYVMQYVDGESLADRLRREGRLPARDVRRVMAELAMALDYAHGEGVVHRDLKPENILIDRQGRALLTDFGVAALPSFEPLPADAGLAFGTPHYMSPEQLVGEHAIDGRSDLYGLGVLGFLMLSGRLPFLGHSLNELSARHLLQRVPSLAAAAPLTPPTLVDAIERCLAKDPCQRWQRGSDLRDALTSRRLGLKWPTWARPSALRAAVI